MASDFVDFRAHQSTNDEQVVDLPHLAHLSLSLSLPGSSVEL